MRVVFLDIDGVLNHAGHRPENPQGLRDWLSDGNVRALAQILSATGASVVLTSSWRATTPLDEVALCLREKGAIDVRLIGATPELGPGRRTEEIRQWLGTTAHTIESWVALDDDWLDLGDNFHRVSKLSGLTEDDAAAVIAKLGDPLSPARRRWISAVKVLAIDPARRVPCPECAAADLLVIEVIVGARRALHMQCPACKHGEIAAMPVDSTR